MRDEDCGAGLLQNGGHGVGNDAVVKGGGIGCHLAQELIHGLIALSELGSPEDIGPDADAELSEPVLFVGLRLDGGRDGGASGVAAPRLIDEIDAKAAAQENVLEAFASVRRGLPCPHGLACAVEEDERVFSGVNRNLVKDARVIAVQGLPFGRGLHGIVLFLRGNNRAAGGEGSLPFDGNRFLGCRAGRRGGGRDKACREQDDGKKVCWFHVFLLILKRRVLTRDPCIRGNLRFSVQPVRRGLTGAKGCIRFF